MTDKSKRDIEKRIESLDKKAVTFSKYCEYHRQCINDGESTPSEQEFFGRELAPSERAEFWHEIRPVWNGEKEPPGPP